MANTQTLDAQGNAVVNGFSTNLTPSQYAKLTPAPQTTATTINNGVSPINVPPVKQDTTPYDTIRSSSISNLAGDLTGLTNKVNEGQQAQAASGQKRLDIMDLLAGKTADTQQAEQQTGVNQETSNLNSYAEQLASLNAQAQSLNREAQAIPIQAQQSVTGQGVTDRGLAPLTAARLRENALRALSIGQQADIASAAATGSQLRLQAAKDKAQQIVDLKYKPLEMALEREKTQYELNKDLLMSIDKRRAEALDLAIKKDEQRIAEEKANKKSIQDMIINAAPYAPPAVISQAQKLFEQGKTPVEVSVALGKYGGDYLGDLLKRSTIAKNYKDIEKTATEIKALKTPLPVNAPYGSNAAFTANLMNSAVNKESLTAGEREKISKSFAVTEQLGNLARNLQKDQTSFFGGKVKEIMARLGQDADAGAIQAQITALVPQIARGTFGEVGVLTNQDTANYKKVIGNLSSPNAQNQAVTAMTLTALRNGVKSQLEVAAASKLDVSRFVPLYQELTTQINQINDDIGVSDIQVKNFVDKNPQVRGMVEDLVVKGVKGSDILSILGVEN